MGFGKMDVLTTSVSPVGAIQVSGGLVGSHLGCKG
jgi:hypothetical protein